jgi:hypothetical protein
MRTLLLAITATLFINHNLKGASSPDTLSTILHHQYSKEHRQQKIIRLCYDRFLRSSSYDHLKTSMVDSLVKYDLSGQQELRNLIQILILRRNFELEKANKLITQSIVIAMQHSERIFLYQFYLNQAYIETDLGNSLTAIYSYRLARKIAEDVDDPNLFIVTDIGISDIYTNIGLYSQALNYLDQAEKTYSEGKVTKASSRTLIYLNKAEIHFKMGQLDSLRRYKRLAEQVKNAGHDMDRNIKRMQYFELILETKYLLAIPLIEELLATGNQYYKTLDRWHLAECQYLSEQLDSALITATQLVADPQLTSSLIKIDSYKLLAQIFQKRSQMQQVNYFLTLALKESEDYTQRISKIGDLASELRLDRLSASYHARDLIYEKERTILVMTVILTILALIAIIVSYRNIRQKNRFQKLLHQARSKELAFINSHQVRKPLANILGICSLMEGQQSDMQEIAKYIQLVQQEAKEMDNSITAIEKKLSIQA